MISGLHVVFAIVASIHELIISLVVELVQHAKRAELSAAQRRELIVSISSHRQECITTIHQVAVDQRIWVLDWLENLKGNSVKMLDIVKNKILTARLAAD